MLRLETHGTNVSKVCSRCKVTKLNDLNTYKSNKSWCKACVNENNKKYRQQYNPIKSKEYRDNNKDKFKQYWADRREKDRPKRLNYMSQYRYLMTREEYEEFITNPCEVCGTIEHPRYVDHKEGTKVARGCLCMFCNSALGHMKENPLNILNLYNYIKGRS